ncbi:E3 ubiquitin-protein ligase NRDP1 [Halotydeus destructor]|nr:E3 ubiquitin-protein ligase NRDP1 [Halotydeus destructor]
MGIDANRFSDTCYLHPEYYCSICGEVFFDAVKCRDEHIFCRECVTNWLKVQKTCPIDRSELFVSNIAQAPRVLRAILDTLDVKCQFHQNGCPVVVKYDALAAHQSKCDYNPDIKIDCEKNCGAQVSKMAAEEHSCFDYLKGELEKCKMAESEAKQKLNKKICSEIGYIQEIRHLKEQIKQLNQNSKAVRLCHHHTDIISQLNEEQLLTHQVFETIRFLDFGVYYAEWRAYNLEHAKQVVQHIQNCCEVLYEGAKVLFMDSDCYVAVSIAIIVGKTGSVDYYGKEADHENLAISGHDYLISERRLKQKTEASVLEPDEKFNIILTKGNNLLVQSAFALLESNGTVHDFHNGVQFDANSA